MRPLEPKLLPKEVSERLAQVRVLIADEDRRIAVLVRNVLESLGFNQYHACPRWFACAAAPAG